DPAHRVPVYTHFVAVTTNPPPAHLEADQLSRQAAFFLFAQRLAADEVALVELHDPGEVGFERRDRRVDFVAVQSHLAFEAQSIARAEPAGFDAELLTCIENAVPDS